MISKSANILVKSPSMPSRDARYVIDAHIYGPNFNFLMHNPRLYPPVHVILMFLERGAAKINVTVYRLFICVMVST